MRDCQQCLATVALVEVLLSSLNNNMIPHTHVRARARAHTHTHTHTLLGVVAKERSLVPMMSIVVVSMVMPARLTAARTSDTVTIPSLSVWVCVGVGVYVCVCGYVCVCTHACVCVCAFVLAFVRTCVRLCVRLCDVYIPWSTSSNAIAQSLMTSWGIQ